MAKRDPYAWYIPVDWIALLGLPVMGGSFWGGFLFLNYLQSGDLEDVCRFAIEVGMIGSLLLFYARLPLYRAGCFWTIGPKRLDRAHRKFYWLAYACVAVSMLAFGALSLRS
jgi:hypothetical protein